MKPITYAPVALLALVVGCSKGDPPPPAGGVKPTASAAPQQKDEVPGSAKLGSPEDNYVAAAVKVGCLGVELDDAGKLAKERAKVLAAHGYTEESWIEASRQLAATKGDAIASAMDTSCPMS